MDSKKVTVGVEDDGGGLGACDRAVRRRTTAGTATLGVPGSGSGSDDESRAMRE